MIFVWEDAQYAKTIPFGQQICGLTHFHQRPDYCFVTENEIKDTYLNTEQLKHYSHKLQLSVKKETGKLYLPIKDYTNV